MRALFALVVVVIALAPGCGELAPRALGDGSGVDAAVTTSDGSSSSDAGSMMMGDAAATSCFGGADSMWF